MRGLSQVNKKIIGIIVGIIIIIIAGTTVYVGMSSNTLSLASKDKPTKEVSTNEDSALKENPDENNSENTPTSIEPTSEEKYFISENHSFYNNTTGYGKIENLIQSDQKKNAEGIIQLLPTLESSTALQTDLNRIRLLAENIVNGTNDLKSNVLYLHRMFS